MNTLFPKEFLAHSVIACPIVPDDTTECPICQEAFTTPEEPPTTSDDTPTQPLSDPGSNPEPPTNAATGPATPQSPPDTQIRTPVKVSCCNNIFCDECLRTWLATSNTCPTCRAELFEKEDASDLEVSVREYLRERYLREIFVRRALQADTEMDFEEEYDEESESMDEYESDEEDEYESGESGESGK